MGGEKSEHGIVVRKLTGKAAMVSDLAPVAGASPEPKGRDLARSPVSVEEKQRNLEARHVSGRSRGGKKAVEPGSNIRVDRLRRSTGRKLT